MLIKKSYLIFFKTITIHPEYRSTTKHHDLALLELENPVTFSKSLKPICLDANSEDNVDLERELTIIGFGIINNTYYQSTDWLQKAAIQEVPLSECQEKFKSLSVSSLSKNILSSQVCARDKIANADACQGEAVERFLKKRFANLNKPLLYVLGDSGGPLQAALADDGKYYLIGLTSYGIGCGSAFPGIYTRVSSYIEWIERIVWRA